MKLSLKTQNRPLILIFALFLGLLMLWAVRGKVDLSDIVGLDQYYQSAVVIGIASIATLLVSEIVPAKWKLTLVYWKIRNPTPGSKAFSDIALNDHRISCAALEERYGPLPKNPCEQDEKFYQIYKPLDGDIGIDDAHKSYLLFRELAVLSFAAMIAGSMIAYALSKSFFASGVYLLVTTTMYLATAIAGQNAGHRFVSNTLAVACAKNSPPQIK
jgi:hypothetical protein